MHLVVSTPLALAVDVAEVRSVRAEDASGAFGLQPGHADFVTVLDPSVVTWRDRAGQLHHVAVRGGMLRVDGGREVTVCTSEAVAGDDLRVLETEVLERFRQDAAQETQARSEARRLQTAVLQRMVQLMRPDLPQAPRLMEASGEEGA